MGDRALLHIPSQFCAGFTVDGDPARFYQFVTMPTRSKTRCGKETIEAHCRDS
jgi:hypothetical protein